MSTKKMISSFLIFILITITSPCALSNGTREENLHQFLKTTENINAKITFPGMKIASNNIKPANAVKLQAMTPLTIRATQTISTRDIISGSTISFATVSDVKNEKGQILIRSNTPVTAQISFAKKKGCIGTAGDLTISDFHTTAVDGTYIPLVGNVNQKGDDKMVLSVVLSVLVCPLFLLMKGEDAQVPVGMTKPAYTAADVYVVPNL